MEIKQRIKLLSKIRVFNVSIHMDKGVQFMFQNEITQFYSKEKDSVKADKIIFKDGVNN